MRLTLNLMSASCGGGSSPTGKGFPIGSAMSFWRSCVSSPTVERRLLGKGSCSRARGSSGIPGVVVEQPELDSASRPSAWSIRLFTSSLQSLPHRTADQSKVTTGRRRPWAVPGCRQQDNGVTESRPTSARSVTGSGRAGRRVGSGRKKAISISCRAASRRSRYEVLHQASDHQTVRFLRGQRPSGASPGRTKVSRHNKLVVFRNWCYPRISWTTY